MSDDPSILSRWSARKRAVAAENAEPPAQDAPQDVDGEARAAELEANRLAAEAVDLDTLDKDSDMSIFLREGVPEMLRKTALQTVWRSNPVFANLDELVDYGEDFGRKDLILKTFTSAYQAGRGYLKSVEDAVAESAPPEEAPAPMSAAEPERETGAETVAETETAATPDPADPMPAEDEIETAAATAPPDPVAAPTGAPPQAPKPARSARGSLRARLARGTDEA